MIRSRCRGTVELGMLKIMHSRKPAMQLREIVTLQGWPGSRVGGHLMCVVSKATYKPLFPRFQMGTYAQRLLLAITTRLKYSVGTSKKLGRRNAAIERNSVDITEYVVKSKLRVAGNYGRLTASSA
ncbi:hypothetical protein H105_00600 [Trichophyton soudanense CBS 452.61]|uniref:Uncharacterized protein n=1 Tax=Trichophyton soudanense CBS 452.61 TaxID=1215331 RepID=A0A022Y738_TRISD|nr:hypothetical protein H105_00600 [Trichophyton soudanense CBS 452.61]EZG10931.1 hypothetical protein H106_00495 [Trichophyton rubrum CBS 735.88]